MRLVSKRWARAVAETHYATIGLSFDLGRSDHHRRAGNQFVNIAQIMTKLLLDPSFGLSIRCVDINLIHIHEAVTVQLDYTRHGLRRAIEYTITKYCLDISRQISSIHSSNTTQNELKIDSFRLDWIRRATAGDPDACCALILLLLPNVGCLRLRNLTTTTWNAKLWSGQRSESIMNTLVDKAHIHPPSSSKQPTTATTKGSPNCSWLAKLTMILIFPLNERSLHPEHYVSLTNIKTLRHGILRYNPSPTSPTHSTPSSDITTLEIRNSRPSADAINKLLQSCLKLRTISIRHVNRRREQWCPRFLPALENMSYALLPISHTIEQLRLPVNTQHRIALRAIADLTSLNHLALDVFTTPVDGSASTIPRSVRLLTIRMHTLATHQTNGHVNPRCPSTARHIYSICEMIEANSNPHNRLEELRLAIAINTMRRSTPQKNAKYLKHLRQVCMERAIRLTISYQRPPHTQTRHAKPHPQTTTATASYTKPTSYTRQNSRIGTPTPPTARLHQRHPRNTSRDTSQQHVV